MINLRITDEQAQRFIEVYKAEYGEDLTIPEARTAMQEVLPLIDLLLQPLLKKENQPVSEKGAAA